MSPNPDTTVPTGRKKTIAHRSSVIGDSARPTAAMRHASQNTPTPDGATENSADSLLKILLAKREAGFRGRGKYHPPTVPDLEGLPEPPNGWIWASPEQLSNSAPYALGIGPFGSNLKVSDYKESGTPLIFVRNIRAEDFSLVAKFVAEEKANELAAHTAEGGDILITKMGEPPGDAAFYPVGAPTAVITADCIKWRLAEDLRVPKFFVYAIRSRLVQQQIQERTRGVAQKKISLERFRDLAIPLPPLPEQRRIVAEIEKQFTRLEAGVAALRRVQANLKRYRAAVLKAACEGQLVPTDAELQKSAGKGQKGFESGEQLLKRILAERRQHWTGRGQYKEPAAPDTANLPPLPEGWMWVSVEQLVTEPLCNGISIKGSDNPPGVRALRLNAMSHSGFDYAEARYLPLADADVDDLWIQEGDFFMSRGNGSLHLVGRGTSAQKPPQPTIFPDTMIRLRWNKSIRKAGWVRALWPSRVVRSQIEQKIKTTAGIYKIAQPQVEQITIPLPPLAEQTRIVAEVERRLSVVEELESVVSANLQRATRLRQSILQKAFTGELVG